MRKLITYGQTDPPRLLSLLLLPQLSKRVTLPDFPRLTPAPLGIHVFSRFPHYYLLCNHLRIRILWYLKLAIRHKAVPIHLEGFLADCFHFQPIKLGGSFTGRTLANENPSPTGKPIP
ncbi:hypothetical protein AVEN_107316-1 [Araneus ventricosus]|uniref:Uncharacterized protein n=1 Tax=Araneus ventricosus TaxID=182803 RepID=A0A4Y2JT95_ARAVE|nr:hypothetical protein AVEN_107316-1 [Araneus ventricosus]